MPSRILLADDDRDLVAVLRYTLQREGYQVTMAYDGGSALSAIQTQAPDLVILDLVMPVKSGIEVLQELPRLRSGPVLVLTALGDEESAVQALGLGADDYVVKPFRPREFKARVQALLRRNRKVEVKDQENVPLTAGAVRLDPAAHKVTVDGQAVQLTRTEFALLHYMMLRQNVVTGIPDLIGAVWGYEAEASDEVVKVTISRLRHKLEPDPSRPRYLVNVPGVGYKFQVNL